MRKIFFIILPLLVLILSLTYILGNKYIFKTGNIVWVSDSKAKAVWARTKISNDWWKTFSKDQGKIIIVYLSPFKEFSSNSLEKDDVPLVYVNWGRWQKWDMLRVSIEWDNWNRIDDSKNKRLSSFIATQISRRVGMDKKDATKFIWDAMNLELSPIKLLLK